MSVSPGAARRTDSSDTTRVGLLLLALLPVLASVVGVAAGYLEPMFANPPGVLGIPLGVALLFVALVLTGLALVTAVRARPARAGGALVVALSIPALAVVVLGPRLIEWLIRFP